MNKQKCAIIGCGFVGATIAFALTQKSLFSELVLIDSNHAKAEGEAMDLSHGLPFAHPMKVYAGDYKDIADCYLIIITEQPRGPMKLVLTWCTRMWRFSRV